jgi:thiol-disulfide isomerase/thioredoxin
MKSSNILFFAFCFSIFFVGCDIVEPPFIESVATGPTGSTGPTGTTEPIRKVLLEDFTGHYCGNCPRAAETANSLKQVYGDQLIVYAAHVGYYAQMDHDPPKYTYDFTSIPGDDLDATFNISAGGLPQGMVNRKEVSGTSIIAYGDWGTTTADILTNPPDINLNISSTYNSSNRELEATINTEFLQALSGTYNLCVYLTEDSIVNWQKDYDASPTDIPDYTHRHVLRGSMNNTWGEEIASGSIVAGDAILKTYSTTLDTEWNENQISIVAFVYDFTTKEVLQAEEAHLH